MLFWIFGAVLMLSGNSKPAQKSQESPRISVEIVEGVPVSKLSAWLVLTSKGHFITADGIPMKDLRDLELRPDPSGHVIFILVVRDQKETPVRTLMNAITQLKKTFPKKGKGTILVVCAP